MWHNQWRAVGVRVWVVSCLAVSTAPGQEKTPLPDKVAKRTVVIWSEGTRLAADLYFPKGWDKTPLPVIVCCNGWGGTKQNTTGRVAARFAQQGYLALAFDYRGWGDSDSKLVLTAYHVIKGITHYGVGFEEATRLGVEWFDAHLKGTRKAEATEK